MPQATPPRRLSRQQRFWLGLSGFVLLLVLLAGGWQWWQWSSGLRLVREAEQLLETDPARAEQFAAVATEAGVRSAWLIRGRALLKLQQPLEAAGCWGLLTHPEQLPQAELLAFAEAAYSAGELRLADLGLAAGIKDRSPSLQGLNALLLIQKGRLSADGLAAIQQEAESLMQTDARLWNQLAEAYLQRSEPLQQRQVYEVGLRHLTEEPERRQVRQALTKLLIDLGDFEPAQALLTESQQQGKLTQAERLQQAQLWQLTGQLEEALQTVEEILQTEPHDPQALLLRGILLSEQRRWPAARADFEAVVTARPYDPEGHYRLGLALKTLGDDAGAQQHLERQAELAAAQRDVLSAQQAVGLHPGDPQLMRTLARHYRTLGQTTSAERWELAATRAEALLPSPNRASSHRAP